MIRFILALLCAVLFVILTLPIVLIGLLIGRFNRETRDIMFLRMVQWIFKVVVRIAGVKLTVIGEERIPRDTAVLYVGNHRSYFDVLITYARCPRRTGYVAKESIKKVPLLHMWMEFLYCLFLDRDNLREGLKTILQGVEYLKSGISICIFPEGTRGKEEGKMLPFKEGSLKMAEKAKVPVVPMAITNSAAVWENQFPKMRPARVILEYGEPIYIDALEKEEKKFLGAYTQNKIQDMLNKNQLG